MYYSLIARDASDPTGYIIPWDRDVVSDSGIWMRVSRPIGHRARGMGTGSGNIALGDGTSGARHRAIFKILNNAHRNREGYI